MGEEPHVADTGVEGVAGELDVRHAQRNVRRVRRRELLPDVRRVDQVETDVLAELELGPPARRDLRQAERLLVEPRRPLEIRHGYRHEVGPLDGNAQPTDPSIWSWIRRFISTAYS